MREARSARCLEFRRWVQIANDQSSDWLLAALRDDGFRRKDTLLPRAAYLCALAIREKAISDASYFAARRAIRIKYAI